MRIDNDSKLSFIFFISFILLIISKLELKTLSFLENTFLEELLVSKIFKDIFDGVLIGLISAYIFYVLLELIPRKKKEGEIKEVLGHVMASIIDSYKYGDHHGHERSIEFFDKNCLDKKWLKREIEELKNDKRKYLNLKFAMETAHSRLEDFRNSLPLAMSLSPQHALKWLVLIDKVRILAENYDSIPEIKEDEMHILDEQGSGHPIRLFKLTLVQRFKEYIEEVVSWIDLQEERGKK